MFANGTSLSLSKIHANEKGHSLRCDRHLMVNLYLSTRLYDCQLVKERNNFQSVFIFEQQP